VFGRKGSAAVADVKVKGTAVNACAVVGAIVSGSTSGFITSNGPPPVPSADPESTPAGSVKVMRCTPPVCRRLLLNVTFSCVVFTKLVVTFAVEPSNCTCVLPLKFKPVMVTLVFPAPAKTAAGVTELSEASAGGLTSVS